MAAKEYLDDLTINDKSKKVGLSQSFHMFDYEEVERTITDFKKLGLTGIRTNVLWANWHSETGQQWFDWLFSTIGKELQLLPCILYPNPSDVTDGLGPEYAPDSFSGFVEDLINRYGSFFKFIEVRLEQSTLPPRTVTVGKDLELASGLLGKAVKIFQKLGKKTVLGGMNPFDLEGLRRLFSGGFIQNIDVLGIDCSNDGSLSENWNIEISNVQKVLDEFQMPAKIWITEAGFSTWQQTEHAQLKEFIKFINISCERVYWHGLKDESPGDSLFGDYNINEKKRHLGMKTADNLPKLLYTMLSARGLQKIHEYKWMTEPVIGTFENANDQYTLITGGAGFVGVNLADKLLMQGKKICIFDNLSRDGVANNLFWLRAKYPENLHIMVADIRDKAAVSAAVQNAVQIFHFAAQVAVTSSLVNPVHDFEVNAQGTLNLLEAIRKSKHQPPVVFASTNKVYGSLEDLGIVMNGTRYYPENTFYDKHGIGEKRNLDFHSPYGCTKGVADQYMIDYSRTFGIKTAVFRMSCIYGPHQFGTEDQGWVAHFLIQALKNKPIMLYGDGKQVRDVLFVDDLVNAYILAMENIDLISGNAFNMGGGVENTISLLELCEIIGEITGKKPDVRFSDWRPGDQKYYVSDFSKFNAVTGWKPHTSIMEGVQYLSNWLEENAVMNHITKIAKHKISNPV